MIIEPDQIQIKKKIKKENEKKDFTQEAKELIQYATKDKDWRSWTMPFLRYREDVCIVLQWVEEGDEWEDDEFEEFEILYLVWRDKYGRLRWRELINSRGITAGSLSVKNIREEDRYLLIEVRIYGEYYDDPLKEIIKIPLSKLSLAQKK